MTGQVERRAFDMRMEATADGKKLKITGHGAVYNTPSQDLGGFIEVIKPGAFQRTMSDGHEIFSFFNHDANMPLGSTRAGTLRIKDDGKGIAYEVDPPNTTYANDLRESMNRGDVHSSSFAFIVNKENWTTLNGKQCREVTECELFELGPVTMPAYQAADSQLSYRNYKKGGNHHMRNSLSRYGWRSFGEQMHTVINNPTSPRLRRSASGLDLNIPSEGGFLVDEDFTLELLGKTYFEVGKTTPNMFHMPVKSTANKTRIPVIDETSRVDGSRWGGIRAYFEDEAAGLTKSQPKFRGVETSLHKLTGLCYLSNELLDDADGLDAFLSEAFAREFAFIFDKCAISGTGAGQPLGVLNSPCLITVNKQTSQTSGTIVQNNILDMVSRAIGNDLQWYAHKSALTALMENGITSTPGMYSEHVLNDKVVKHLMGFPINELEQCSVVGTTGDIILGDFSWYALAEKQMAGIMSAHVQFLTSESVLRFTIRVAGMPVLQSPITPFSGTNTVSTFIALQSR